MVKAPIFAKIQNIFHKLTIARKGKKIYRMAEFFKLMYWILELINIFAL